MDRERRCSQRFDVSDVAFAEFEPDSIQVGQLIDISEGGLSFRYIESDEWEDDMKELSIFTPSQETNLNKIPFLTVYDSRIEKDNSFSSMPMRRRSVKFGKLNKNQRSQLGKFISSQSI